VTLATSALQTPALMPTEHTIALYDGTPLFYRIWLPPQPTRALFLFHRGHEHSGRFLDFVDHLADADTAVFAWDARGHGQSPGERGYAPSFAHTIRDIDFFVRTLTAAHNIGLEATTVLAHSVASVAAAAWVHDYAPPIRALVLVAPAFRVKLYVPFAIEGLRLLQSVRPGKKSFVKSYVRSRMLTHDPVHAASYDADPLIAKSIAVNILLELHDTSTRILQDAAAIRAPTLILSAGSDWVVKPAAQRAFFNRLGSPFKRFQNFPGMYHDLMHEGERDRVFATIREFMDDPALDSPVLPLLDADRRGFTHDEYVRLSSPLPVLSPRRYSFAAQRLFLHSPLARLSQGIRIGQDTGFNSGGTLDYIYENRPRGPLVLGKIIDRFYLGAIGWRGIRVRKLHIQELLKQAIGTLQSQGRPVHIVDIASGPGRYLLETLAALQSPGVSALLRDYDVANLNQARIAAQSFGLSSVSFAQGDAFDRSSLALLTPAPTIAIASGIFELIPDNQQVLTSLRSLAAAMQANGGVLLYTGQPWHPQLEMIARVLTGMDHKPWVMRRRTQLELDDLVREAGFRKTDTRIDPFGIFTVSLATIGGGP